MRLDINSCAHRLLRAQRRSYCRNGVSESKKPSLHRSYSTESDIRLRLSKIRVRCHSQNLHCFHIFTGRRHDLNGFQAKHVIGAAHVGIGSPPEARRTGDPGRRRHHFTVRGQSRDQTRALSSIAASEQDRVGRRRAWNSGERPSVWSAASSGAMNASEPAMALV